MTRSEESDIAIRPGRSDDAERLAAFAARAFADTFGASNAPEDMAAYLAESFGLAQQQRELADEAMETLLAVSREEIVGFAQLHAVGPAGDVPAADCVELRRLYVDPRFHGTGLAGRLLEVIEDGARVRGAAGLWLGVWEHNARARAFYRKCGFVDVGEQVFVLGSDPQRDVVMMRVREPR